MSEASLCLDCGLCCDGTLYSFVALKDTDLPERLVSLGMALTGGLGETVFAQPCSAYRDHCCSIYESRPSICRRYRCALLQACESGTRTRDEVRLLIEDTRVLRDRVRSEVEGFVAAESSLPLQQLFELMIEKLEQLDPEARKQVNSSMLLDVGTLGVLLAKRFEPRGATLGAPETEIGQ